MGIVYKKGEKYTQIKMLIFSMRTLVSVTIFILGIIILLRKRRLPFHRDKFQFNVVTLKETLGIAAIFYLNNLNYLIGLDRYLEMFILSGVSLLVPVLLIITTRQSYPSLWTECRHSSTRRCHFFMTRRTPEPRSSCETLVENERTRQFIYVKSSYCPSNV